MLVLECENCHLTSSYKQETISCLLLFSSSEFFEGVGRLIREGMKYLLVMLIFCGVSICIGSIVEFILDGGKDVSS